MNKIILHGDMERFGGPYMLDVSNPREAVRALECQEAFVEHLKGFSHALRTGSFRVIRKNIKTGAEVDIDEETLTLGMKGCELHVIPKIAGAGGKGGGVGKFLLGIVIVGAAIITGGAAVPLMAGAWGAAGTAMAATAFAGISFASIATFGAVMALGGLAMMLAPSPGAPNPNDQEDDRNSFLFNGIVNVQEQGHPVPLVYGRFRVGSVVISSGLSVEGVSVRAGGTYDGLNTAEYAGFGTLFPSYPASANALD